MIEDFNKLSELHHISANTISANTISANTISADHISADTISADTISPAPICADTISADPISPATIYADPICADPISINLIVTIISMINELITEFHDKVPFIIIKDFINLESETEIKMKFINLKFKLHVQNRLIIRGASAASYYNKLLRRSVKT